MTTEDEERISLDSIFDTLDDWLIAGEFSKYSEFLADVNVASRTIPELVAMLTATPPAAEKVPSRAEFFGRVCASLRERGESEEIVAGLEGL